MKGNPLPAVKRPTFKADSADDLRELLAQAELIVANLRGAGLRAQTLLFLLDTIEELMVRLEEAGVDLRPEAARLETVERLLLAKDSILVGQMRRLGGLAAAREEVKPTEAQWWWYLDRRVAERQRQQLRRGGTIFGVVVAMLLIFSLLYRYVFPPDPRRVAVMDKSSQAEAALQKGDVPAAIAYYQEAIGVMPEDPELHVWVGVLEEMQGHSEEADRAYAEAERLLGDRSRFLVMRGMSRSRVGELDLALEDGQGAVALNPNSAEAYFLLGGVYENMGQRLEAMEAFEKCATLAGEANNSALVVLAKTRLGMMLQAGPGLGPSATAEASAEES